MLTLVKTIVAGSAAGFMIRQLRQHLFWRYSRSMRYALESSLIMKRLLKVNSNCVDVGCYKGYVLREMLRLAPEGVHYAFEPVPAFYQRLASMFPNARIHNLALSDAKEEAPYYNIASCPAFSGFRSRNLESREKLCPITVQTDTLDNIISNNIPIQFIKIVVEGSELSVLKGAVETVSRSKPIIVFEHGLGGADFFGTLPEEIYDLLVKTCGLRVSLMTSWLNHEPCLSRWEFADQFYQGLNYYFVAHP